MKNLDEILGEWGGENFVHLPHIYIVRECRKRTRPHSKVKWDDDVVL